MATRIIITICLLLSALKSTQASILGSRNADKKKGKDACGAECVTELVYPFVLQSVTDGFRHALWAYNTTFPCLTHQHCRNSVDFLIDHIANVTTEAGISDAEYWVKKNKKKTCEKECLHDVLDITTRHAAGMGMAIGMKNYHGVDAIRDRWIPGPMVELYQMMSNLSQKDTLFNLTEFTFALPTTDLLNKNAKKVPYIESYTPDTKFKGDKKHHSLAHRHQSQHKVARAAHEIVQAQGSAPLDKRGDTVPYNGYREPKQTTAIFWDRAKAPLKLLRDTIKHKNKVKRGGSGQHPHPGNYIGLTNAEHEAIIDKNREIFEEAIVKLEWLDQKNIVGREDSWLHFQQETRFDNARDDTPWDRWISDNIDKASAPIDPQPGGGRLYDSEFINDLEMPSKRWHREGNGRPDGKGKYNDIWQWVQNAHDDPELQPWTSATSWEYPEHGVPEQIRGYQMEFKSSRFRDFATPVVDDDGDHRIWPEELFNKKDGTPVHPRNKEAVPAVEKWDEKEPRVKKMSARVIGITGETQIRYLTRVGKSHQGQSEWEVKDDSARSILDAHGKKLIIKLEEDSVLPSVPYVNTDDGRGLKRHPEQNMPANMPPEHPNHTPTERPALWTAHSTSTSTSTETSTSTSTSSTSTSTRKTKKTKKPKKTKNNPKPTDAHPPPGFPGPPLVPPPVGPPLPWPPVPVATTDRDDNGHHTKTDIGPPSAPMTSSSGSVVSHSKASLSTFRSWPPMSEASVTAVVTTESEIGTKKAGKKSESSTFKTMIVTANSTMTSA